MVVKLKEKFEKTRHVKNNDESKAYILLGQRNVRYHDRNLSNNFKVYLELKFYKNSTGQLSNYDF